MTRLDEEVSGPETVLQLGVRASSEQTDALSKDGRGGDAAFHAFEQWRIAEAAPQSRVRKTRRGALERGECGERILVGVEAAGPKQTRFADHAGDAARLGSIAGREGRGSLDNLEHRQVRPKCPR